MNSPSLVIIGFPTSGRIYYEKNSNSTLKSIACGHGEEGLVLVHSGCCSKNTIDWVAYKQQTFISRSSGVWELQDQGTGTFGVW